MNWTRGLIRLWLLASLAFTVVTGAMEWRRAAEDCSSTRAYALDIHPECSEYTRIMEGDDACRQHKQLYSDLTPGAKAAIISGQKVIAEDVCRTNVWVAAENVAEQVALFIGASVALVIVGAALAWVVRGFQRVDQPKSPLA